MAKFINWIGDVYEEGYTCDVYGCNKHAILMMSYDLTEDDVIWGKDDDGDMEYVYEDDRFYCRECAENAIENADPIL